MSSSSSSYTYIRVSGLNFERAGILFSFIGALPCLALIPGLFFIPESPRWLVSFIIYIFLCVILQGFDCCLSQLSFYHKYRPKWV